MTTNWPPITVCTKCGQDDDYYPCACRRPIPVTLDDQSKRAISALERCQHQRDEIREERDAAIEKVAEMQTRMAAMFIVLSEQPETKASELDGRVKEYLSSHLITF